MKRRYRLRDAAAFGRVRKAGRCRRGKHLVLCCLDNDLPHSRFGFVVSKRVGNAVTRNRVKRRLRAIFYAYRPHIKSGFDVVVICRPQTAALAYRELEAASLQLVRRLSLLSRPRPVESATEA